MKKLLLVIFYFISIQSSIAQIDSIADAQRRMIRLHDFKEIKNHLTKENLHPFLNRIYEDTYHSLISYKELIYYFEEINNLIEDNPDFLDLKYQLDLTRSLVEMYTGNPDAFFAINEESKRYLREKKLYQQLFSLNLQVCHFLPSVNYNKEVLSYFYENLQIVKEMESKGLSLKEISIAPYLNSFGVFYESQDELDSAFKYLRLGLSYAIKNKDSVWIGIISGNIGSVLAKKGDYIEAERLLTIDKNESLRLGETTSGLNALLLLIDIKLNQRKLKDAEAFIKEMVYLISNLKTADIEVLRYYESEKSFKLGKYYLIKGDKLRANEQFELAYSNLKKWYREKRNEISLFNTKRFEFEKNYFKVSELENRSKNRQYILWISAVMLLSLIVLLILERRFNKKLKEKNELIQNQTHHLRELNEQKLKLFSIVAHDMRNPYANLRNLLDLHSDQALSNEEFIAFCRKINLSIHGLNETFENIMSWAKLSMQQGIQIENQLIYFNDLYQEIFEQLEANLSLKNISINYTETTSIPFYADKNLLVVVLRNLIQNAIKFSPKASTIFVSYSIDTLAKSVQIEVKDRGIGMSKQQVDELFEKGSISSIRGTEGEKGGGLGLMITKEFIEAMKGSLELSSTQGEGSSFKVNLPYVEPKNT